MARWVMQNFSTEATIHQKYIQKVSLDNGSILLQNIQASDEATYRMLYENHSKNKEIQLCVRVPPSLSCKPSIKHEENFLIASLDNSEICGKPLASVLWMDYHGVSFIKKSRIELPHENEAGTYRACIEGEALTCLKTLSLQDNCENYTIGSRSESRVNCVSSDMIVNLR
ncbi:hypothetical protein ACJMK2_025709 [Sinanodonta woodiana]|uniref:Uncharacterized protein n=1 Tax=Sinanodonta woodiana TaxID=1069815 RepID=A0ABD3XIV2_SINWO